ncbi:hypothetical protein HNY73_017553 [Argiope bruennichi]|uniref:Uncharacterized protein n=1 Tax=Argiope bruennichi TaxID=94029 RepID=A0A8T0EBE9_ARGBR|nr:hypothetical protein HNY73_017553 [Argiope bruennichi]
MDEGSRDRLHDDEIGEREVEEHVAASELVERHRSAAGPTNDSVRERLHCFSPNWRPFPVRKASRHASPDPTPLDRDTHFPHTVLEVVQEARIFGRNVQQSKGT